MQGSLGEVHVYGADLGLFPSCVSVCSAWKSPTCTASIDVIRSCRVHGCSVCPISPAGRCRRLARAGAICAARIELHKRDCCSRLVWAAGITSAIRRRLVPSKSDAGELRRAASTISSLMARVSTAPRSAVGRIPTAEIIRRCFDGCDPKMARSLRCEGSIWPASSQMRRRVQNGDEEGDCGADPATAIAVGLASHARGWCHDGVRNGDETGVDCGGSCAPCCLADEAWLALGDDWCRDGVPIEPRRGLPDLRRWLVERRRGWRGLRRLRGILHPRVCGQRRADGEFDPHSLAISARIVRRGERVQPLLRSRTIHRRRARRGEWRIATPPRPRPRIESANRSQIKRRVTAIDTVAALCAFLAIPPA